MNNLKDTIRQCLETCQPPVDIYSKVSNGYYKISRGVVADIDSATKYLQSVLEPYIKDEKLQGEIDLLKSDNAYLRGEVNAYEKFLKRNGIIADVKDEDDEQIEKESNNGQ